MGAFFGNFDLKVVHIHPFWPRFCLQALFDLPGSIFIVSRPQMAKKKQNSKILLNRDFTFSTFLGFGALGLRY